MLSVEEKKVGFPFQHLRMALTEIDSSRRRSDKTREEKHKMGTPLL